MRMQSSPRSWSGTSRFLDKDHTCKAPSLVANLWWPKIVILVFPEVNQCNCLGSIVSIQNDESVGLISCTDQNAVPLHQLGSVNWDPLQAIAISKICIFLSLIVLVFWRVYPKDWTGTWAWQVARDQHTPIANSQMKPESLWIWTKH